MTCIPLFFSFQPERKRNVPHPSPFPKVVEVVSEVAPFRGPPPPSSLSRGRDGYGESPLCLVNGLRGLSFFSCPEWAGSLGVHRRPGGLFSLSPPHPTGRPCNGHLSPLFFLLFSFLFFPLVSRVSLFEGQTRSRVCSFSSWGGGERETSVSFPPPPTPPTLLLPSCLHANRRKYSKNGFSYPLLFSPVTFRIIIKGLLFFPTIGQCS